MPYIAPGWRKDLADCELDEFQMIGHMAKTPGELNYVFTSIILDYFQRFSKVVKPNYTVYNEVIGVLECVKQELYRRMVAPYEDQKCRENGDVYP